MGLSQFCRIKWERARDLKRQARLAEAEEELLEALEEEPQHPLLKSSLAELYLRQGKLLEAKVLVDDILAFEPQQPQALVVQGQIFFRQKNFPQALQSFRQAQRHDPRPYLAVRVARSLKEMRRYPEALETLNSALVVHRDNVALLKEKALILNRMQRLDEALELYERLRRLSPEDSFVQKEIIRLRALKRPDSEVVEELQAAVKIPSRQRDAQLHGLLAKKLKDAGQVREAAAEYRTAAQLQPDDLYFLKQQGYCHYGAGEYPQALECLTEAFRKDPSDFIVRATLEKIYGREGRLEEFLSLLEETFQLHPDNMKLLGKIKKLRKTLEAGS